MVAEEYRHGELGHAVEQEPAKPEDLLVMGTNNSSIVSKRSVERFYYPNDEPFFRFFVQKFQRRAPLINRGYFLRLHVIDVTLRNFLRQPSPFSTNTKVVVNLGCGSDVIPWQCWTRYPDCKQSHIHFVDVDFPDLVRRKRQVVLNTPELLAHLSHVDTQDPLSNVLLRSQYYTQVGVDLCNLGALETALASVLDIQECHFLFVAEVSITYMNTNAADALIQWAATLGRAADFCLLEQILPDGPEHPFANQMLQHFDKLGCSIKSVGTYPTISTQSERFSSRGWSTTEAQSLWDAWSGGVFLSRADRQKLDLVEPFDEHEEFALFASHYLLLHARSYGEPVPPSDEPVTTMSSKEAEVTYTQSVATRSGLRRYGAALQSKDTFGNEAVLNCLGLGSNNRLSSYDVYARRDLCDMHIKPSGGPSSRMCATLTDLGHSALLCGGRSSPSKAMRDCWIFRKEAKKWERTHDLPVPLYRHSACRLGGSSLVLVLGGKSRDTGVSRLIAVRTDDGWQACSIEGSTVPKMVYGAVLTCSGLNPDSPTAYEGFVAGGLSDDGVIDIHILAWKLVFDTNKQPTITFARADVHGHETVRLLSRFGAACVQRHGSFVLVGGVGLDGFVSRKDDIVVFSTSGSRVEATTRLVLPQTDIPRPLIIGSSVVLLHDQSLVIIGGGATCFSMGTFWTRGVYTLQLDGKRPQGSLAMPWKYSHTGEIVQAPPADPHPESSNPPFPRAVRAVRRARLSSELSFEDIVAQGQPIIIEGLNIGSCTAKWSLDYLVSQIGADRKVVIHDCQVQSMDFNAKNFRYSTMAFSDFAQQIKNGKRLYLRSLSADAPTDQPASLQKDFPGLAADFVYPHELRMCEDNMHSSILRVTGPVKIWLHFDVQANAYCQINGSKRMLLFPPSDVTRLSFAPGASSSSVDVFDSTQALAGTHPFEADLRLGDVLYLPPLWLHTAAPTSDVSIAVNVFFRSLEPGQYAPGRDVYGNRDLAAYDKGRQDVSRIVHSFDKLPASCKQFYLLRLADELAEKARHPED